MVPSVSPEDIGAANWLLTKEALQLYSAPHRVIQFNYGKFAGDYNKMSIGYVDCKPIKFASYIFDYEDKNVQNHSRETPS